MKTCTKCHREDPPCGFHKNHTRPDGLQTRCKECDRTYQRAHPEYQRAKSLKRLYSITPVEYGEMCATQNGLCAICGNRGKLVVDHDHKTHKVRGLLCHNCNNLIGHAHEDTSVLWRAAAYLNLAKAQTGQTDCLRSEAGTGQSPFPGEPSSSTLVH